MCGIGGFFSSPLADPGQTANAMLLALSARGPDASHVRYFSNDGKVSETPRASALLHARLSIIDPRSVADQPMHSANGRYWLCYNGEVYDWQEAARPLADEAPFLTHSDTEFILRGAEAWGIDALLKKLTGMFAFALLDWQKREVILARDRFGKKPVLWWSDGRSLAFASTLRGLLPALPDDARRLSAEGLDAYLAHRYLPAPMSIARGVQRLPAGHMLRWTLDGGPARISRWHFPAMEAHPEDSAWLPVLDNAIKARCVADRPVGLFLSGGIDSSVIANRLVVNGQRFEAFTASFPGSGYDETAFAAALSQRLGLPHRPVIIPDTIRDDFTAIVAALDEPFADPSAIPLWYLARETTRHVKVVLGGDGGDELFAGYKRYRKHLRSAFRGRFRVPSPDISSARPTRWQRLLEELGLSWERAYSLRFSGMSPTQRRFLQPGRTLPAVYWAPSVPAEHTSPLETLLAIDEANYLPEYILRKGDLTTMAYGLELRAPLLDHHLAAALRSLPPEDRFTQPPKQLLAAALPGDVAETVFGSKKRGFNPPLEFWLKHDLAERYDGLGKRLQEVSNGQLGKREVDAFVALYRDGCGDLAENVLQLLMLDESLEQLKTLGIQ